MATLQKIRNRAGLLVVVIGLAMLAFILTDLLNSSGNLLRGGQDLGSIDGTTINYTSFERELEAIMQAKYPQGFTDEQRTQERDLLWDTKVRAQLLQPHFEEAGVMVSSEELEDLITGARTGELDPIAKQLFGLNDPSNQPTSAQISQMIQRVLETDPKGAKTYIYYEDLIRRNRLNTKYFNLIKEGLYITNRMAADNYLYANSTINGRYVSLALNSIQDSAVTVSESEMKSYYNENKEDYKVDESADLAYVVFNVEPSRTDFDAALAEINGLLNNRVEYNRTTQEYDTIAGFRTTLDDSAFVMTYSDANAPFNRTYMKEGDLPENLKPMLDAEVGYVIGPYMDGNTYKVSKLTDVMMRPDSVKARHILLSGGQQQDAQRAKVLADSLMEVIENGGDFAELAKEFSEDPGSAVEGGDLGYFAEGTMVQPFNDACFEGKVGDVVLVASQFGFHIIEIMDQKGESKAVQIATLSREVVASSETADNIYRKASAFASFNRTVEKMQAAADSMGLTVQQAANMKPSARVVASLGNAREVVKWAFNEKTKEGAVQMFDRTEDIVVVGLVKYQEEGYQSFENAKANLEIATRREKKKDMLTEKANAAFNAGMSLDEYSSAVSAPINSFSAVKFANPSVPGAGFEPAWVGAMFAAPVNEVSEPFKGSNGVYVFVVDQHNVAPETSNLRTQKASLENGLKPRAEFQIFNALKEEASIEDNRAEMY